MIQPKVIYEDSNFLVINKPAGLLVHSVPGKEMGPTLADWAVKHYPEMKKVGDEPENRPGIVHRLDKDTSGIMVLARNQEYFEYLKSLFQGRKIEKKYLAWVRGVPPKNTATIDSPIGIRPGSIRRSIHSGKMAKEAVTDYVLKECREHDGQRVCLLEVSPRTGRTHQIRVHLASIGHPIVGDRVYGGKSKNKNPGQEKMMLHAFSLSFEIKPGRVVLFEASPPTGFGF
ncbi:MAG TPA: RluA family pseudouridine synthase [Candidatus Paceibacterota bacterium]